MNKLDTKHIDKQTVGFFRFKRFNGEYLLTSDIGDYCFLEEQDFNKFITGGIEQIQGNNLEKYQELIDKNFVRNRLNFEKLTQRYFARNSFLEAGTVLHIIVTTLRCDHKCIYCQSNAGGPREQNLDMDIATARTVVDRIFESPGLDITIEFQGGEPLLNFELVKFIIEYAHKINKRKQKNLTITLVSNLSYLTEETLRFLINNNVNICTSFDGPEAIHNKNRVTLDKRVNSYKNTVKWLKKIRTELKKQNFKSRPNALLTITKSSLPYYKEIVDEYIKLDLDFIHLRPMNTFAFDKKYAKYTWADYIKFYEKAMDYILSINLKGKLFRERTAMIFLHKILTGEDPNYLDIRSPCGAGIGQMAYNYNGDVYTCDEGRMLSRLGNESFRIGNVKTDSHIDMLEHPTVKAVCISSCLDNIPGCEQCVYKPYCGICPLLNYAQQNNIFTHQSNNERCLMHKAVLDYLFDKIKEKKYNTIFENWIKADQLPVEAIS